MAQFFAVSSGGSNSNDGRDTLGLALSSASYDDTGHGDGEHRLEAGSSVFTAAMATNGALIYLTEDGAGNVVDGLYEIATYISGTVVLLSESASGGAGDSSSVGSSDGPWATVDYAVNNTAAATDEVRLYGTFTPSARISPGDNLLGNEGDPSKIRGCNQYGVVDGTIAHIQATSLGAGTDLFLLHPGTFGQGYVMEVENIDFDGNGGGRDLLVMSFNPWGHVLFINCTFQDAGRYGYGSVGHISSSVTFEDCEFKDGANDVFSFSSGQGHMSLIRCRIHDNTGDGVQWWASDDTPGGAVIDRCLIYDNAGVGIQVTEITSSTSNSTRMGSIKNCVIYGNTGNGIDIPTTDHIALIVENNSIAANGGYGLDTNGQPQLLYSLRNNNFPSGSSANTSGDTDVGDVQADGSVEGVAQSSGNFTDEPGFTSVTDGSEDFTPASGSALKGAALDSAPA